MDANKVLIGAAIMGLMAGSMAHANTSKQEQQEGMVLCKGANSCAGKGACGATKGKNSCQGKGNAMMTKANCDKKGFQSMPAPQMQQESKSKKQG